MLFTLIALLILAIAAITSFYKIFVNLRKARTIEDTPTSKIRSASQGYVELSGFAKTTEHEPFIMAPLTNTRCLWFSYTIEKYTNNNKSGSWKIIKEHTSENVFTLDDNSGECVIYPQQANVSTHRKQSWHGSTRWPNSASHKPQQKPILLQQLSNNGYRYTEKTIQEGDYLYALGMFQTMRGPTLNELTKTRKTELLKQWKQDYDTLTKKFDTNGDGEIDMREWEKVRKIAHNKAQQYALKQHNNTEIHVMAYPPKSKPFIISTFDPKDLSKRYQWRAVFTTATMVLFIGLIIYMTKDMSH